MYASTLYRVYHLYKVASGSSQLEKSKSVGLPTEKPLFSEDPNLNPFNTFSRLGPKS